MNGEWQVNVIGNLANNKTLEEFLGSCKANCSVAIEFRNFHPSLKLGTFKETLFVGSYKPLGNPIIPSKAKDAALFQSVDDKSGVDAMLSFAIRENRQTTNYLNFLLAVRITRDNRKNVFAIAHGPKLVADQATFNYMIMPGDKQINCIRAEANEDWIEFNSSLLGTEVKIKAKMINEMLKDKSSKIIVELSRL